jgi:glycosylphosphatidylinositol deacylase
VTLRARRRRRATTRRATRARDARRIRARAAARPRAADDASGRPRSNGATMHASGRDVAVDLAVVDALRRAPTDDERARWRKYTREDVAAHARLADGWIVVRERVFDITAFATTHPGFNNAGQVSTALAIARALGKEASDEFEEIHSARAWTQLRDFQIGVVTREGDAEAEAEAEAETETERETTTRASPVPAWLAKDRDFWVKYAGGASEGVLRYLEANGCPQGRSEEDVVAEVALSTRDAASDKGEKPRRGRWWRRIVGGAIVAASARGIVGVLL